MVLDIDVGNKDLQQCADAVMRLRAEFLFSQELYHHIQFNFTSGHQAAYRQWIDGYRPNIKGSKVSWTRKKSPENTYSTFRNYLEIVFTYAGTLSLAKELEKVPALSDMSIGDVFIQGGSPGHAVIVVDMATDLDTKQKYFLLAQSYMPAQNIHILKNPATNDANPWYRMEDQTALITPEWTFDNTDLKRFAPLEANPDRDE